MIQKIFIFIILLSLFAINLDAESIYDKKLKFETPYDFSRWKVLDNFNFSGTNNWLLSEGIKTNKEEAPRTAQVLFKKISPGVTFSHLKGNRFLSSKYKENPTCLGYKIFFPEFIRENVLLLPKENYKLKGNCRKISFWLLGRNKNIDFEIVLSDYDGRLYYLPVTKLNFFGWKYFEIDIRSSIIENYNIYVQKKIVAVTGFVISNNPARYSDELYRPIYLYVDQLEFTIDQFRHVYPGVEISDDW